MTLALGEEEVLVPGDVAMFDGLGACLVLAVRAPEAREDRLYPGERAVAVHVEVFAIGNEAPDIP